MEWFERIKMLRKQRGWSQDTLAQKAGYTDRSMISKIEKGCVDLQRSQLIKFADIFDVSPSWLLGSVEVQQYKDGNGVLVMSVKAPEAPKVPDEKDEDLEELIEKYKQLDDEGKEMMHERLDSLIKHGHVKEPEVITLNPPQQVLVVSHDGKKTRYVSLDASAVVPPTSAAPAPSKFRIKYRPHTPAGVGRPNLKKILTNKAAKRKKEG